MRLPERRKKYLNDPKARRTSAAVLRGVGTSEMEVKGTARRTPKRTMRLLRPREVKLLAQSHIANW